MRLGAVAVQIAGETRALRLTWGALRRVEIMTGRFAGNVTTTFRLLDVTAATALLWAALIKGEPETYKDWNALSLDAVDDLIQTHLDAGGDLKPLLDAIEECVWNTRALGPKDRGEGAEKNDRSPSTDG